MNLNIKEHSYDWLVWLFFIIVSLVVLWQSATSLAEQGFASGGPLENAAIFPRVVAWIMIALSLINGFRILSKRVAQSSPIKATTTTKLALIATTLFLLYLFTLKDIGYYLATPVLLATLFWLFGIKWIQAISASLVFTVVIASVFEGMLNVVFPLGFLQFTLFG